MTNVISVSLVRHTIDDDEARQVARTIWRVQIAIQAWGSKMWAKADLEINSVAPRDCFLTKFYPLSFFTNQPSYDIWLRAVCAMLVLVKSECWRHYWELSLGQVDIAHEIWVLVITRHWRVPYIGSHEGSYQLPMGLLQVDFTVCHIINTKTMMGREKHSYLSRWKEVYCANVARPPKWLAAVECFVWQLLSWLLDWLWTTWDIPHNITVQARK